MHVCPMFDGPVPHVGGPILPPGAPTVLIDFLPAATVTSMATCVGPPDVIVMGSTGVFINFLPAARMGDQTAHGGVIVMGSPTCIIGEIGMPSPGSAGLGGVVAGLAASGVAGQQVANASKYSDVVFATPSRVGTEPNQALFWSGRSKLPGGGTVGGAGNAASIAKQNGGTTLETLIDEREIDMPDWNPNDPSSVAAWKGISSEYAQGASGQVRVVLGSDLRPGNVWETTEFPALKANPKVTQITSIDPATGETKLLWTR